jgi:hypothetical protein
VVEFSNHYQSAKGNFDLYVNFIERGYKLLKREGQLGQIVPNKFFKTDYGEGLRSLITGKKALTRLVDFGASQVFDATTYTCLLFLSKEPNNNFQYVEAEASEESLSAAMFTIKNNDSINSKGWIFADDKTKALLNKLSQCSVRLLDLPAEMSRGSSSGNDEVFMLEQETIDIEEEILRIPIFASDFSKYYFAPSGKWRIIFPYVVDGNFSRLYTEQELKKSFPKAYSYLRFKKSLLKKRKQFREWYGYSAARNLTLHDQAHIIVPLLANQGLFALIPETSQGQLCPMASGGFTITLSLSCPLRPDYILGLLNSRLLFWKLEQMSNIFRGGWITCTKQYFGELPIRTINFSDPSDKAQHDRMVQLVEQMIDAKRRLGEAHTDKDKIFYENKCAAIDQQINQLVYELYGLSDEEIRIIGEN